MTDSTKFDSELQAIFEGTNGAAILDGGGSCIFPYLNTKVITFTLKRELMTEFKKVWLSHEEVVLSPGLRNFYIQLERCISYLKRFNIEHFCVEWYTPTKSTDSVTLVAHVHGEVWDGPKVFPLLEVYEELKDVVNLSGLDGFKCQTIEFRNEFKSILTVMCQHASYIMGGGHSLPFRFWD
jgi:hypothetical protein